MNSELKDPIILLNDVKEKKISLEKVEKENYVLEKYLNRIRIRKKPQKQKKMLASIKSPFNRRNNAINFSKDYS